MDISRAARAVACLKLSGFRFKSLDAICFRRLLTSWGKALGESAAPPRRHPAGCTERQTLATTGPTESSRKVLANRQAELTTISAAISLILTDMLALPGNGVGRPRGISSCEASGSDVSTDRDNDECGAWPLAPDGTDLSQGVCFTENRANDNESCPRTTRKSGCRGRSFLS